ncbi:MAG: hypothetical protein BMS9Abin13_052 [Patescibacteria group bacterium]|nr:MAG: hypothetical protein BMS9Abin13_052 [Patescibacteria group bacterium]
MLTERQVKFTVRWSVASAVAIALFWAVWYFMNGSVPVVHEIHIAKGLAYTLPFEISRWWDILLGPIYSIVLVLLLTSLEAKRDEVIVSLAFGLIFGLGFSLISGLVFGLGFGLIHSLGFILIFSLIISMIFGLDSGLGFSLAAGLGFSLVFGVVFILVFGLGFGLGASLVLGIVFGLCRIFDLYIKPAIRKLWR